MVEGGEMSKFVDSHSCEYNPTPRSAFTRIHNIAKSIMKDDVYDNYPDYVKNGGRGLMVNKFLVYWPIVCGHLSANANAGNSKNNVSRVLPSKSWHR